MVTSGATPLEGLPGHTTCGELDPSIVLTLADKLHWGPEQINGVLTMESGLLGLTGSPMTMASLLEDGGWQMPPCPQDHRLSDSASMRREHRSARQRGRDRILRPICRQRQRSRSLARVKTAIAARAHRQAADLDVFQGPA